MKITNIEGFPIWGGFRNYFFLLIDTDEGIYGVGEGGIPARELASMALIEHLKPVLIGEDPFRTEHLWQKLWRCGFFPAEGLLSALISAIDIALWDIKGKALGVPIYQLLGGKVRDKVVCYPHNSGHHMDVNAIVESCLKTKAEGWKFVRWGLPSDGALHDSRRAVAASIKQMQAVREAIGDEIEITFDVHTRLDLADALLLCTESEQFRPYFIEDPLRSENPDSYKTLRPRTRVPLAAGEQFSSKWRFREMIENEWIDYARIDLCIVGGITEARKVAGWAETHYINIAVHNPLGPISAAACLQFNLACPNFGVQEQPAKPGTILPDVVPVQPGWEDGYMTPTDLPGLGIEFDRIAARKHPFKMAELPHLHREDGAFTNW